jgi:DNA (cytosine-5)-methyltransferase 1
LQSKKTGGYSLNYQNPIAIQHSLIGRDKGGPEGKGWTDDGSMFTLDARGAAHAVAFKPGQGAKAGSIAASEELFPTLGSASGGNRVPGIAFGGNDTRGEIAVDTAINAHPSGRYDFESETFIAWHEHRQDDSIRIQENGTSPTVSSTWGTGGGNIPYVGVRRLTPGECEKLQGFPKNWTAVNKQADGPRYKQLGNAVAVPVVEWIGRRLIALKI